MGTLPEVTVILVTYNHAPFVAETLDSIHVQTLQPHRVLVMDDASSDGCADQVRAWRIAHSPDLELIAHVQNRGLCRTLNEALNTVQTPLYAYISGDDVMAPRRLEKQVQAWVRDGSQAAVVYSNATRIDEFGAELTPDYRTMHAWPEQLSGHLHTELLRRDWLPAASLLMNTAFVREVGGYDERWFFEDYDLLLRLAAGHRFVAVDEPLVSFRELSTSLGSTRFRDEDPDFLAARVGIWTKQFGVSSEGDAYLRHALPPLAIRLWASGRHTDVALAALESASQGRDAANLRLRAALIRLGVRKQPAVLSRLTRVAATLRRR
ncbi:glycosyltransferase family 2 protein [Propionibacteriaceae bacterium G1746]|uniref:glycosyltransferase family 2 protein n=1 Tax=Aestuariimicrobium sp. G57 TaxID=3418485 RepID=UPI003C166031